MRTPSIERFRIDYFPDGAKAPTGGPGWVPPDLEINFLKSITPEGVNRKGGPPASEYRTAWGAGPGVPANIG